MRVLSSKGLLLPFVANSSLITRWVGRQRTVTSAHHVVYSTCGGSEGVGVHISNDNTMADAPGMRGYRSRNEHGTLRQKRSDTHVETIEKQYDRDFGVRGDMQLGTLLEQKGYESLNDLLHNEKW